MALSFVITGFAKNLSATLLLTRWFFVSAVIKIVVIFVFSALKLESKINRQPQIRYTLKYLPQSLAPRLPDP